MSTKERVITYLFLFALASLGLFCSAYLVPILFSMIFHLGAATFKAIVCWQVLVQVVALGYISYQGLLFYDLRDKNIKEIQKTLENFDEHDSGDAN